MSILLATNEDDFDLSGTCFVLEHTAVAACDVRINLWVGATLKPCVMLAGVWELRVEVKRSGSVVYHALEPYRQEMLASDALEKLFVSKVFDVNADDTIYISLRSPNLGDTDVTVYTELIHVTGALPLIVPGATGGLLTFGTGAGQINPDGEGKVPVGTNSDKTGYGLADGAITAAKLAANAITAAKIANGALAIAKFAADVGSTAYASNPVAQAVDKGVTNYDPPTNAEMELRTLAAAVYATAAGQDEIKTAVDSVGNSEDTILNSESQVYNTDTADGSTVVNEES